MSNPDESKRPETASKKMQAISPKSPVPKPKVNPRPAPTKADIAAQKRIDKMVIKRMRKR